VWYAFLTVIDNIEHTKKIIALSGLRSKMIAKPSLSTCESVVNKDVFKRLVFPFHFVYIINYVNYNNVSSVSDK